MSPNLSSAAHSDNKLMYEQVSECDSSICQNAADSVYPSLIE